MRNLRKSGAVGWGFVLPSFLFVAAFSALPILGGAYYSFTRFNGFNAPEWIGLENYAALPRDGDFLRALQNTGIFALVIVPCEIVLALAIAAVLAEKYQNAFGRFVRGALFVPVLCSSALAGNIFYYVFSADGGSLANTVLSWFGAARVNWLGSRGTALGVICLVNIWKNFGYYLVILYAGIMDVPRVLYEAAEIDGASKTQQFFHVTLPSLKSVVYIVVTLCTIASFQVFDIAYVMTGGGPGNGTTSLVLEIYSKAFKGYRFGYASAIGMVLFLLVIAVTLAQRKFFRERAEE